MGDDEREDFNVLQDQPLTVEQAIANLQGQDKGDRYYAAWWLGRFRVALPEAITALIDALRDERDLTPDGGFPLRRNAARALGKLADLTAVQPLMDCLLCSDFYVREAAVQSLGRLGDGRCIPQLIGLLRGGVAAAQPIPNCPHLPQPYDAILEALGMLGAVEAVPLIEPFLQHSTELVQYSAARAMYQLTRVDAYADRLVDALAADRLQLRRAALADIGAIGYFKAADAVFYTLAENSLKLIALKGILEALLDEGASLPLTEEAIRVMALMDGLL